MDLLAGKTLQRKKGNESIELPSSEALKGIEIVGMFFAAHWCASCREFTKKLLAFYNDLKSKNVPFEIIFMSWDNSPEEMRQFIQSCHGDWLAVPFKEEVLRQQFIGKYGVECIPELIIFKAGHVVTKEGRWDIELKKGQCFDSWKGGKRATTEDEVAKYTEVDEEA